jgi:hypothetical protein
MSLTCDIIEFVKPVPPLVNRGIYVEVPDPDILPLLVAVKVTALIE